MVLFVYWEIYEAAKFSYSRRRRAVLPLPATVQVRGGLRGAGLGEEDAVQKGEMEAEA